MEILRNVSNKHTYEIRLENNQIIFATQNSDISLAKIEARSYLNSPAAREFRELTKTIYIDGIRIISFKGLTMP